MSKRKKPVFNLDPEEQELSDSFDRGEWQSVKNLDKEITKAKRAAKNYLHKNTKVNVEISNSDLDQIKRQAAYEGLSYQTFIASILHKYAAGHLQQAGSTRKNA